LARRGDLRAAARPAGGHSAGPDLPEVLPPEAALPPAPPAPPPEAAPEPAPTIGGVVSQVQTALKRRGYYAGRVTGRFDPETSAAVRRFQADNGLAVDGVINTALLNALERPEAQPQGGIPAPPPAGESRDI
jgi:peptidoglycan hydrolase-like protein with peptidoglycan-binding domain